MAVAFVKAHTVVSEKTLDTSASVTLDTGGVPAGNLIVLAIVFDNAGTASKPTIAAASSITRQAGETNNWQFLGASRSTSTTIGAFASGELWAIKTTVAWAAGTYTVTLDTAVTQKAAAFIEYSGTEATLRSTSGTAYSTTTTAALASTTSPTPVVGDLAVGFMFQSNAATAPTGDIDTTGGAWSTVIGVGSTGGSAATNNFGAFQYKVLTTGTNMSVNTGGTVTAGNGAIAAVLQATPAPTITQAGYRFYDDGTESRDTPVLADSLSETNYTVGSDSLLTTVGDALGQTFLGNGNRLARAGFWLKVQNGTLTSAHAYTAVLYAHTGTFGAGGAGTGSALATSTTTVIGTSLTTSYQWFEFDFAGYPTLTNGTPYVIGMTPLLSDATNRASIGGSTTSSHPGNRVFSTGGATGNAASDQIFRVYTYNGSIDTGALAAQNTSTPVTLSGSDVNIQVRIKLQSTNSTTVQSTDDWVLQWEKNGGTDGDSYAFSNYNDVVAVNSTNSQAAQSFQVSAGGPLRQATFYLCKSATPTGTVNAVLYAHDGGTYGGTGKPTGTALATSTNSVTASTLPVYPTMTPVTFTFDGSFTLSASTSYFIALVSTGGAVNPNYVYVAQDTTSPTHPGALSYYSSGAWGSLPTQDLIFQVNGWTDVASGPAVVSPYVSSLLDNTAPTTNRLT